jgi:hypothetical protein
MVLLTKASKKVELPVKFLTQEKRISFARFEIHIKFRFQFHIFKPLVCHRCYHWEPILIKKLSGRYNIISCQR